MADNEGGVDTLIFNILANELVEETSVGLRLRAINVVLDNINFCKTLQIRSTYLLTEFTEELVGIVIV